MNRFSDEVFQQSPLQRHFFFHTAKVRPETVKGVIEMKADMVAQSGDLPHPRSNLALEQVVKLAVEQEEERGSDSFFAFDLRQPIGTVHGHVDIMSPKHMWCA